MVDNIILEVKKLSKSFDGVSAVDDVSFSLKQGEILGIIGPNGSGKSTLINMVTGFITRTSGQVFFKGRDISKLPVYQIANEGIARTFQIARPYYSLTPVQNLLVPLCSSRAVKAAQVTKKNKKKAAMSLLERVDFENDDNYAGMMTAGLPLAHIKKLELARCLALEPEIIICDEIFSGLSAAEINAVAAVIDKLSSGGIAFIMIEHRFRELFKLADRVLVLDFGRKITEGKPQEILENKAVREAYLGVGIE